MPQLVPQIYFVYVLRRQGFTFNYNSRINQTTEEGICEVFVIRGNIIVGIIWYANVPHSDKNGRPYLVFDTIKLNKIMQFFFFIQPTPKSNIIFVFQSNDRLMQITRLENNVAE